MDHTTSPVLSVVILAAAVAISILVRRGRLQSRSATLAARERMRPLAITLLDPIISVVVIGPFVVHFISMSSTHVAAAIVGAGAGVVIGYTRARIMFVRAVKQYKSIVLRRSGLEYGLLLILIILRATEGSIESSGSTSALLAVTALASLALVEAVARAAFIVKRYIDAPEESASLSTKVDPPRL
ncbi:MAG TPA: hypothetical protein VIJ86_01285 [Acidimicrobiales bacterium]